MSYKAIKIEELKLKCKAPLEGMYKLSPLVWEENGIYQMLVRAVNTSEDPTQKVARVYSGTSKNGLSFKMSDGPVIAPGTTSLDKDGCEDPTVVCVPKGYLVYYTGWNQTKMEGQLLLAKGKTLETLRLDSVAISSKKPYLNPKEASVTQLKNGKWNLLFEYADQHRSKLGRATSKKAEGPWKIKGEFLEAVDGNWDSYHLSPGPVLADANGQTVMFYNGSDDKARWRIGWVKLGDNGKITERSKDPLITPPKSKPGETDIAFAASAVLVGKQIWLYYTTADKSIFRAIIALT
ncbi:hypothetical protein EWM62_14880 [Mucilaginibacter terrigena]|uniref:Glycosidase n=1 Tax=Mucilaginibacter terrigena TaxID=2492395 RepID=A0A4Q5LN42_9SPHI|nr:hypothetical protein [Mucilaginibacter terrigena]RYU89596.1 hypothetical protein EWM62_14880 [Mucilaginibacter terrigena]